MTPGILDSSVILALLNEEPGWEALVPLLIGARISTVNLSEVIAKLVERGADGKEAAELVSGFQFVAEPFGLEDAEEAGAMRAATSAPGLSFGDRACLALARRLGGTAYTADRAWSGVDIGVEIVVVR